MAPGFIDLHSHGQTPENYRFKAMDGVTTALELEVGVSPVPAWYAAREGKALINFGASSGHLPARMAVMHDSGVAAAARQGGGARGHAGGAARNSRDYRRGLEDGALGVGLGIAYIPLVSRAEILDLFRLAAEEEDRGLCSHAQRRAAGAGRYRRAAGSDRGRGRYGRLAARGAHHQHGAARNALCLEMIEGARRAGWT